MCMTGLQAKAGSWERSDLSALRKGWTLQVGIVGGCDKSLAQAGSLPRIKVAKMGTQAGPQGKDVLGTRNLRLEPWHLPPSAHLFSSEGPMKANGRLRGHVSLSRVGL